MPQIQLQPVLAGGAVFGVLAALPVVGTCCCLWMIGGGMVAAYLTQQNRPDPVELGQGALLGLLAGVAGAVMYAVVSVPIRLATGPLMGRIFEGILSSPDIPPEVRDLFEGMSTDGGLGSIMLGLMVMFPIMLILGCLFSTFGGLLGALIFRKTPPAVPASSQPPPPELPA